MFHKFASASHHRAAVVSALLLAVMSGMVSAADAPPGVLIDSNATTNSIPDHGSPGALVGLTVRAVDPDGDVVTYSLPGDAAGQFAINPTSGVVTVAGVVALGEGTTRTILARASAKGLTAERSFVINVTPNTHAPLVTMPPAQRCGLAYPVSLPLALDAKVADADGLRGVKTTWSVTSGPGPVVFANPDAAATTATFRVDGMYVLRLTATDGIATVAKNVEVIVDLPGMVTVDNGMPGCATVGAWKPSNVPGLAGSGTLYTDDAAATVTWTLPADPGWHELQVYAPVNATAQAAQVYTIQHAGGTTTRTLNLTTGSADWLPLGCYQTTGAPLTISTGGARSRADAVRSLFMPGFIVDNGTPGYSSKGGPWYTAPTGGFNGGSVRYSPSPDASATWTITTPEEGRLLIYGAGARSNADRWSLTTTGLVGSLRRNLFCQGGGSQWYDIAGMYEPGTSSVTLTNGSNGVIRADALRFIPSIVYHVGMPGYVEGGDGWHAGPNFGLVQYPTRVTSVVGASMRWRVALPPGRYAVFGFRWTSDVSCTKVIWSVFGNGVNTVETDETTVGAGSGWIGLGQIYITSGVGEVRETSAGSGELRACAVRFEPIFEPAMFPNGDG